MNPLRPKGGELDINKLTPQERRLYDKYGKLPNKRLGVRERKYFDSGDYALSKAGVTPQNTVGTAIPNPENIPHASNGHQISSISPTTSTSPVNRESSLSHLLSKFPEPEAEAKEEGDVNIMSDQVNKSESSMPNMVTNTTAVMPSQSAQKSMVTQEGKAIDMAT